MRNRPKPNIWILLVLLAFIVITAIGVETGYLAAWWNSSLQTTYPEFPFGKVNKSIKLLQFLFGLLAVFELIAFPTFFKDAKDTFVWTSGFYGLTKNIGGRSLDITRNTLKDYLESENNSNDVKEIFSRHVMKELDNEMEESENSFIAKLLTKLSVINVSPRTLKTITFVGFFSLTIVDIFTN